MSLFGLFLVYAVSWWLVLFMVLPWGVRIPLKPGAGHAASAPERPRLRRKLLVTSLLTLLVPLGCIIYSDARAESGIYHAGSNDCPPPVNYTPPDDIKAKDTVTLDNGVDKKQFEQVDMYLNAPADEYTDPPLNDPYQGSSLSVGKVSANTSTGEVTMNGKKIGGTAPSKDCK
jgi:predicted secreted protein